MLNYGLYIKYNREERNICSHLFRLLHIEESENYILKKFLEPRLFTQYEIFSEVALLRDAYYFHKRKSDPIQFVDDIIMVIKEQENVQNCRLYSALDNKLTNPSLTHPRQFRQKAKEINYPLNFEEEKVYGCLQAYFNAKPDLAIILDDEIVVYEAKLTMPFDEEQLMRTRKIAEIWSKLLFRDLGFTSIPKTSILKLGLEKYKPDISWENIVEIASTILNNNDKSLVTIKMVLENSN